MSKLVEFELQLGAGHKQRVILFELYRLGVICWNWDLKKFERDGFQSESGKGLLKKTDKPLMIQIKELQKHVDSLNADAKIAGIRLSGGLESVLDKLKSKYKLVHGRDL